MLAFSTAIIAVMQPIATRSPFCNVPQHLTSLSDKVSSWDGLGSSLLNLYRNLGFPASLSSALLTTLYFSTLSGLGISSSFLFNVPTVNDFTFSNVTTLIGSPSVRDLVPPGTSGMPTDFTNVTFDWYRSGMGVGMLNDGNTSIYAGVSANRIYDTLVQPMPASSNSSALVGYTDFNVKCGSVPNVSLGTSSSTMPVLFTGKNASDNSTGDYRYPALLQMNYTLDSVIMVLFDSLSVSGTVPHYAVSRLWQPAG